MTAQDSSARYQTVVIEQMLGACVQAGWRSQCGHDVDGIIEERPAVLLSDRDSGLNSQDILYR